MILLTSCKALSTLATIYSRRIRRLSPKTATVAEFGDNPNSATTYKFCWAQLSVNQ